MTPMLSNKKIADLLGSAVVLAMLAGCGASNGADPKEGAGAAPQERTELIVSAAASLTDSLNEIKQRYETSHPTVKLTFNFGASGALQRQIEQGAPADLFLSASAEHMKALVGKKLIEESDQAPLLQNELVVVVPKGGKASAAKLSDLAKPDIARIAIGISESVPAGAYAKQALAGSKLWDELQPKLVQAKDVRQVLTFVETGNADAGFVYRTDARTSDRAETAFAVDPVLYSQVLYPVGIVKATKHPELSRELLRYLQGDEAGGIFRKFGFKTIAGGAP